MGGRPLHFLGSPVEERRAHIRRSGGMIIEPRIRAAIIYQSKPKSKYYAEFRKTQKERRAAQAAALRSLFLHEFTVPVCAYANPSPARRREPPVECELRQKPAP